MPQHARPLPPVNTAGAPSAVRVEIPTAPDVESVARPAPRPTVAPPGATEPAFTVEPLADAPWYRAEPWLALMASAFLPIVGAVFAPGALKLALLALGGALVIAGLTLLARRGAPQA